MAELNPDNQAKKTETSGPSDWAADFNNDMDKMSKDLSQGAQDFHQEFRVPGRRRNSGWFWGLILIVAGSLILFQNFTNYEIHNWWAFLILLPSIGSFAAAFSQYQDQGRFSRQVRNSLLSGVIFACVAVYFLLGLSLGPYWPVLIILGGLAILISAFLPD